MRRIAQADQSGRAASAVRRAVRYKEHNSWKLVYAWATTRGDVEGSSRMVTR